jgi:hypothetical protein
VELASPFSNSAVTKKINKKPFSYWLLVPEQLLKRRSAEGSAVSFLSAVGVTPLFPFSS